MARTLAGSDVGPADNPTWLADNADAAMLDLCREEVGRVWIEMDRDQRIDFLYIIADWVLRIEGEDRILGAPWRVWVKILAELVEEMCSRAV